MLRVLDRLGPRFAWRASGGASDFAHCSESRQSHKAVSSSCRGRFHARSSTDYPFTSSCSPRPDRQDAVSFRCLAGSTARKGLAPFGVCAFPSARARVSSPAAHKITHGERAFHRPSPSRRAAGEDTRAPAFGRSAVSASGIGQGLPAGERPVLPGSGGLFQPGRERWRRRARPSARGEGSKTHTGEALGPWVAARRASARAVQRSAWPSGEWLAR